MADKADAVVASSPKAPNPKNGDKAKKPKVKPTHPTYLNMITEAIEVLKDRSGSSQQAIKAKVEELYGKEISDPNWKKKLAHFLKIYTLQGKLDKIRASFKLSDDLKKTLKDAKGKHQKSAAKPMLKEKDKAPAKPKKAAADTPKKSATPAKKEAKPKKDTAKPKKVTAKAQGKSEPESGQPKPKSKADMPKSTKAEPKKKVMRADTAPGKRAEPQRAASAPKKAKK